jgi:AdoMet dependent proline di-methyltransferase
MMLIRPESIKGCDDNGNFYASHAQLMDFQSQQRDVFYAANKLWWEEGGYGGKTDDEAMIGDDDGERDGDEGLMFLDRLLEHVERKYHANNPNSSSAANTKTKAKSHLITAGGSSAAAGSSSSTRRVHAIDAGAGVGRVTKHVLLKRFENVRLVEANSSWSKRSRVYLGRKRAGRCHFTCANLQDIGPQDFEHWGFGTGAGSVGGGKSCGAGKSHGGRGRSSGSGVDLIWLQWTLQYMTDMDAIHTLKTLAAGLVAETGYLVIKENRPFGTARSDRFQLETPSISGRYDITRPDAHHRLLFQKAGLQVDITEQGEETNTYALSNLSSKRK